MRRRQIKDWDEQDAYSGWRHLLIYIGRPGVRKKIKKKLTDAKDARVGKKFGSSWMTEKYPKFEMTFEKARFFGWFWYCTVWGRDWGAGSWWAPTYTMAQKRAARYARKILEWPKPVTIFFDENGNQMDFKYYYGSRQ